MKNLAKIDELEIENKRVLIRCDFNVPIDQFGNITNDIRIKSAMMSVRYCLDRDCKIILMSHFGRPKDSSDKKHSLNIVAKRIAHILKREVKFCGSVIGSEVTDMINELKGGEILLLENLRYYKEESSNDSAFAKELASYGDIYINDAFGVCHRKHASVCAILDYFKPGSYGAGFLLQKEIDYFSSVVEDPKRPLCAIIGGSKVSSKLKALYKLISKVDKLIIGGGMAFTFLKSFGYDVGKSIVEDDLIDETKNIMNKAKELGVKIYLPVDVVTSDRVEDGSDIYIKTVQDIQDGEIGLDIGPATQLLFSEALLGTKTIMWNGPMGVYELDSFKSGSFKLAESVANSSAITVIGGGDTADMMTQAGYTNKMNFISTGGGASLMLLEGSTLPAVEKLLKG